MRAPGPPERANWLITKLVPADQRESMIGDLIEQYHRGRSSAWYWRQALGAIATNCVAEIRQHIWLAVSVGVLSFYLADIVALSGAGMWAWRLDQLWYPHVIHSRWSWLVINPWAYRLQPYLWTSNLAWCFVAAALTWIVTRLHPRQRGLVIALILLGQLSSRLPYVWTVVTDWLREPRDPIRFYGMLWFVLYTFVVVPSSILLGGRRVLSS